MALENAPVVLDRSRYPDSATFTRINNAVDVFHLYGRRAIFEIYLFDAEVRAFTLISRDNLKDWVHSLAQDKKFDRFECIAIIDDYRANLSAEDARRQHENWKERKDRTARQRSGYHGDEEKDLPGGFRRYLDE